MRKLGIFLILCISSNAYAQNEHLRFGVASYKSGKYELAEPFLRTAFESGKLTNKEYELTLNTLVKVYWEIGKDHQILKTIKGRLPQAEEQRWWCRILSRRGHTNNAKACWLAIGDTEKSLELVRMRALLDTLVNPGAKFGYRSGSDQDG